MRSRKHHADPSASDEAALYDWLLTQRLLHEAGQLEAHKVRRLNESVPGWSAPVTDDEAARGLTSANPELRHAFTAWWNVKIEPGGKTTYAQIRERAAKDGVLRQE